MSIGMVCTLGAIVTIIIIVWFLYKSKDKLVNHPIVSGIASIALVLSVAITLYLFFENRTSSNLCFRFSDTSVAVLSVLVTVLLGWNIWNIIDTKGLDKKVNREVNYLHNKLDYDMGLIYGYFSQMLCHNLSTSGKDAMISLALEYMINSLKILSKLPNTGIECNSIANFMVETLKKTDSCTLQSPTAKGLIERLGEIENRNNIKGIKEISDKLSKFINNENT